jgi:tRNA dimethylallyltransferase
VSQKPQVLAIVGLTGTGKTELACRVARRVNAEVISVDSMQVYRGMDIGTAKPSAEIRREIPHHGLDLIDPDGVMSAGHFARYARDVAHEILARGRRVILCGGTGLYARAFAGGLIGNIAADPGIRAELAARDLEELQRELHLCDPASAERIHPRDRVRIERAIEAFLLTRRPLSAHMAKHRFEDQPFEMRWLCLTMERDPLWRRIQKRVAGMFRAGLVDEVRGLHAAGYGPCLRPLQAIGYREVGALLQGKMTEEEAREAIFVATRRYAKRQRTWFRAEPGIKWIDASHPEQALKAALQQSVQADCPGPGATG